MKATLLFLTAMLLACVCSGQQNYYDVTVGEGYGIRLWQSDSWKIHMGNSSQYLYGPVTDYSIKVNNSSEHGFGWTWGVAGATPVAAIDNTGKMQIAGHLNSAGLRIPGRYTFSAISGLESAIEIEIPTGSYNAIRAVSGPNPTHTIHFFDIGWGGGAPGMSSGAMNLDPTAAITFGTWNSPSFYYRKSDGYVGLGTTSPDARLAVKGQVHAQEVKVDMSGTVAPDYVFVKDYALPSLETIKSYIEKNHHLPEVPSAKDFEANGMNVGEMNLLLLKKIEELTLYVIDLKKQNDVQQEEINQLKKLK